MIRIDVKVNEVLAAIKAVNASMRDRKSLFDKLGGALQKETVRRIRTQGDGTWAPLAPSTRALTGKKKAFLTIIPYIKFRSGMNGASVYFSKRPRDWSLDMHQTGFSFPPYKSSVMKLGKGRGRKSQYFQSRKGGTVPARRIFPTAEEASAISAPIVQKWVDGIIRRKWK